uniref:O-methyltransferase n=1 Tax=Parascaris equorum TaxID=6256 RepID=A0A914RPG3_PAREQ
MIGAPEVHQLGQNLIRLIGAKRVLDIDYLISSGQAGTWDFAFIDADKHNYPNYYEKCVQLLRPGGVILIDNALWHGSVARKHKDQTAMIIDATNQRAASDPRVDNFLLNLGDGTH